MYQQITPQQFDKFYADIIELRNEFLLPVNAEYNAAEDDVLHDGLYLSEMVELTLADTDIKRLDALVDGCYVVFGKLVHLGLRTLSLAINHAKNDYSNIETLLFINSKLYTVEMFEKAWDIIHHSNLSKLCKNEADKKATLEHYKKLNVPCKAYKTPNGWIVKATKESKIGSDIIPVGKFLKNVNYTKADLTPLFS